MTELLQSLVNGVSEGSIYALAALGVALVFGVIRLANFAHGDLITAASYALVLTWRFGAFLSVVISVLVTIVLALLMELVVFRWLRTASPATLLIASFGLSFLLQRIYESSFGNNVRVAAVAVPLTHSVTVGGARLQLLSIVSICVTGVLLVMLWVFLRRTGLGLQVQAAAADFRTARLLGVRANRVIAVTFGMSGLLAAAVGFVLTVRTGAVNAGFGQPVTLLALVGAVIGGIDKLSGALAGGFVVGFATSQLSSWLPQGAVDFRDTFVFALVIVVLIVKPSGLLVGRAPVERA